MAKTSEEPDWVDDVEHVEPEPVPTESEKTLRRLDALANTISQCAESMATVLNSVEQTRAVALARTNHEQSLMWLEVAFNDMRERTAQRVEFEKYQANKGN